jgi:hypothetical protein
MQRSPPRRYRDAVQISLKSDRERRTKDKAVSEVRARFEALTPREQEVIRHLRPDEQADCGRALCERNHRQSGIAVML